MAAYQAPKNGFRTFVILWATQSVSVIGTALTVFAMNIFLATVLYPAPEQKPQLAGAITLLNLSHFLPMIILAPLAGAWSDRHNRKQTMFWCDIISGGVSALLVAMMLTHSIQLWSMVLFGIAYGVMDAFHGSAFDTAYAMLVPDRLLPRANGMMQTIWALSTIVAPGLAAFLIGLPTFAQHGAWGGAIGHALAAMSDGTPLAIGIDSVTFFLAAAVLPFLYVPSPVRKDLGSDGAPKRPISADIKEGVVYIGRRRPLLWLLATFTMANMLAPLGVLMPLIVKFNLGADWSARGFSFETALATLNTVNSVGAVLAGMIVVAWGGLKRHRVFGVIVPLMIGGLLQLAFGLSHWLYLSAGLVFTLGLLIPVANVHSQAIWQTQVPRELQGRVFAARRVIAQCAGPLGMTVAGWLAGKLDPGVILAVMSGTMATFCLLQLLNPQMLKVEDKEYLDSMAAAAAAND